MADNMKSALEQQLGALSQNLEGTIEQWRESEDEKRQELEGQIKALEGAVREVRETLKDESRSHLPGVEVAKNGERDAFSIARACRALARHDFADAPYEAEVLTRGRVTGTPMTAMSLAPSS